MAFTRNQLMIIGGIVLAIALFVGIFVYLIPYLQQSDTDEPTSRITLSFWGVESPENFSSLITQYSAAHPNVEIRYTQFPQASYERTLLNAFATDQGPDIFMIHRSWGDRYDDKLLAAEQDQITPSEVTDLFPAVVSRDFVRHDYVSALPLSIDSLSLFYNRALFNKKGVAVTPKTWGDIKMLVPYFTEFAANNQIKKSAIALGGSSDSIPNAPDILALLMLQFGAEGLEDADRSISFDNKAASASDFYLQFSSPGNPYYTWNDSLGDAYNALGSEDTAMVIGYFREIDSVVDKNPYLDLGVLPIPQNDPSDPVNYADYWGLTVSPKSDQSRFSWRFIVSATTDPQLASLYTESSNTPPALRQLINSTLRDPLLGTFSRQALTARAPYQYAIDPYRDALSVAIKDILSGRLDVESALRKASNQINNRF